MSLKTTRDYITDSITLYTCTVDLQKKIMSYTLRNLSSAKNDIKLRCKQVMQFTRSGDPPVKRWIYNANCYKKGTRQTIV